MVKKKKKTFLKEILCEIPKKFVNVGLRDDIWPFSNYDLNIKQESFPSVKKFRIMIFLMGKGYWKFIIDDEQKPIFLKFFTP
jgi:hypothetical protein